MEAPLTKMQVIEYTLSLVNSLISVHFGVLRNYFTVSFLTILLRLISDMSRSKSDQTEPGEYVNF